MLNAYLAARNRIPNLKFVIVPRHAERGGELEELLKSSGVSYYRRTSGRPLNGRVDCLLADTTGELVKFIQSSDLILMGKTFAGNDEGQNIIEPARMGKAIITGPEMKNFRQAFDALRKEDGVLRLESDSGLADAIVLLAGNPDRRTAYGDHAREAVGRHAGALKKTIKLLEENLSCLG
jgi:3-deoxy-D-manno-octulosonic-acid transferase